MGYVVLSVIGVCFLAVALYDAYLFVQRTTKQGGRYPVVGYKRVLFRKLIPNIAPVVKKGDDYFVLDLGKTEYVIPLGTQIYCFERDGLLVYRSYMRLMLLLLAVLILSIFGIAFNVSGGEYLFLAVLLLMFVLLIVENYQIYGRQNFKTAMLYSIMRPKQGEPLKLSKEDYAALIASDQLLSFDEAVAMKKRDARIELAVSMPFLIFFLIYWLSLKM